MNFKAIAYIVSPGVYGVKTVTDSAANSESAELLHSGRAEVGISSIHVGGAGINCQDMNAVIFMSPCYRAALQSQAIGTRCICHPI